MPHIKKLIASILFFASIFTAIINLSAANLSDSKNTLNQSQETIKVLKKKLSLDYTNSKFETDLTKDQKVAILTALKKWKGELPVDNTFTVTSIANLKTDTTDNNSKVKKLNKETPNAQVVYMWAKSINSNWPKDRIPTGEESEVGDPRFTRTEFNILLKQTKNGKYKASIERDAEIKTESLDVSESALDDRIYQDLFSTNKVDNAFTAMTDILVDPGETISSFSLSTVSSTSLSSISFSSSQTSNSQATTLSLISSTLNTSSTNLSSTYSSITTSSKTVGFLEGFLNFGSLKASAQVSGYSWPWRNGETWLASQGWHDCNPTNPNYEITLTGCALDFVPYNGASDDVVAPISTTVVRACKDNLQGLYKIGDMSILHLQSGTMNSDSATVNKASKIGTVFTPPSRPYDQYFGGKRYSWYQDSTGNWKFETPCGTTGGKHIHVIFKNIVNGSSSVSIDGSNISGGSNYNPILNSNGTYSYYQYTSQNTPPTNTTQHVLFRDANNGNNSIWKFSNTNYTGDTAFPSNVSADWKVAGFGDFNADGYQDILWRNSNSGQNVLWEMQNGVITKD